MFIFPHPESSTHCFSNPRDTCRNNYTPMHCLVDSQVTRALQSPAAVHISASFRLLSELNVMERQDLTHQRCLP